MKDNDPSMPPKRRVAFNARQPAYKQSTLARQVARQNLTRLNNALWVTEHSHSLVRGAFTSIAMPSSPTDHGCFGSESQWEDAADDHLLWTRQHVLLSAASLLEVYFQSAVLASLWSQPSLVDRSLQARKEVEFLKYEDRALHLKKLIGKHVESMTKGTWVDRMSRMSYVFGALPPALLSLAPLLQDAQTLRNKIAHGFGHNSREPRRTPWEPVTSIPLERQDILAYLITVTKAIRLADGIFIPVIGSYELLHEFHAWITMKGPLGTSTSPISINQDFRRHIGTQFGSMPNKAYLQSMVEYYNHCR
jgi:hypothetical protein